MALGTFVDGGGADPAGPCACLYTRRRAHLLRFSAVSPIRPRRLIIASIGLLLLGAAVLGGYLLWRDRPPAALSEAQCVQQPARVEPSVPWRFQFDPDDIGVRDGWSSPSFDDSKWDASAPGVAWDEQGYPVYAGVAWYRATFTPPAEWGTAYLGVSQVDDTAELWVNGVKMDWDPTSGPASQAIKLPAGRPLQLSFRVVNLGGPGGIKQPVRVGRSPWSALEPDSYARWLAALHPDWPMPGWTRNEAYAWTFTGLPAGEDRALIGSDGALAPWPAAPNVSLWLYDPAAGGLAPAKPVFSLLDGNLPIPKAGWTAAGLKVETTLFRSADGESTVWQATLRNEGDALSEATLLAVVRPLGFNPGLRPTYAAGYDQGGRLWLNGQPFMQTSPASPRSGVGTLADVLDAARRGAVPAARDLPCAPIGDAAAASAFPLHLQPGESFQLILSFPADAGAPFPRSAASPVLEDTRQVWRAAIGLPSIAIPDKSIMDGYQASLGYLLLALSPAGPRPGPLEHNKVWVRDAAFVGEALLGAGQGARVSDYLPKLFAYQGVDGSIPAIIGSGGPEAVDEWDAPGEAIYLVAAIYRYNHDLSFLQQWEPSVKKAGPSPIRPRRAGCSRPAGARRTWARRTGTTTGTTTGRRPAWRRARSSRAGWAIPTMPGGCRRKPMACAGPSAPAWRA
ncbi:MAG: hypothetical protein M1531_05265 [Chloroflexi bacterium]|nr:hypothetical protein [Chloroflexota bacterium]